MTKSRTLTRLAAGALALVAGCGGSSTGDGNGRVTVLLTDAPATFKAAVVTITKITLQGSGGETVLSSTKTTTNLLTLANDAAKLVDAAVVKPGTYTELRFYISGGYVEVPAAIGSATEIYASSSTYEGLPPGATVTGQLKMPSFAQSGLKIDLPGDALVIKAESKLLLIDFDVAQSFGHEAGNSGSWVMHPVVKGAEITVSGNVVTTLKAGTGVTLPKIGGTTQVKLSDFKAVLKYPSGSEKALPFVDLGTGTFGVTFKYLLPNITGEHYSVDVTGPVDANGAATVTFATNPAHPATVTVGQGVDVNADFTLTSATSP